MLAAFSRTLALFFTPTEEDRAHVPDTTADGAMHDVLWVVNADAMQARRGRLRWAGRARTLSREMQRS